MPKYIIEKFMESNQDEKPLKISLLKKNFT